MSPLDDSLLQRWFSRNDPEAFRLLTAQHAGMVLGTAQRILQNRADAEDVAQETFQALAAAPKPPVGYLGPWLHRVALHLALKKLRGETRRRTREAAYSEAQPMTTEPEWNELAPCIDEALDALPEKLRAPLVAHFMEGRSQVETARTLGLPRQTVTNQIQRGLEELRGHLRKRGVEIGAAALAVVLLANAGPATASAGLLTALAKLGAGEKVVGGGSGLGALLLKLAVCATLVAGGAGWWLANPPRERAQEPSVARAVLEDGQGHDQSRAPKRSAPAGTSVKENSPANHLRPEAPVPAQPKSLITLQHDNAQGTAAWEVAASLPVASPETLLRDPGADTPATDYETLKLELPEAFFGGTPLDYWGPNLEPESFRPRPSFLVPPGTQNVARNKAVTSSSPPLVGALEQVVDGDKDYVKSSMVELGAGLQWVQIDLGADYALSAVVVWHFHEGKRVYFDVVVWGSKDVTFLGEVVELYNNDHDNSAGLGGGQDKEYIESNRGRLIPVHTTARYVRLFSQGNTSNDLNNYVEVEVYGVPPQ